MKIVETAYKPTAGIVLYDYDQTMFFEAFHIDDQGKPGNFFPLTIEMRERIAENMIQSKDFKMDYMRIYHPQVPYIRFDNRGKELNYAFFYPKGPREIVYKRKLYVVDFPKDWLFLWPSIEIFAVDDFNPNNLITSQNLFRIALPHVRNNGICVGSVKISKRSIKKKDMLSIHKEFEHNFFHGNFHYEKDIGKRSFQEICESGKYPLDGYTKEL